MPTNRRQALAAIAAAPFFVGFANADQAQDLGAQLLANVSPLGERSTGNADAPNVLIEYASATCDHCAAFHLEVLPALKAEYIDTGRLRYIFREFPLDQLALAAFMLARCVPEDRYFATIDLMFRRQVRWMKGNKKLELQRITQMTGLDKAGFDACLKRQDYATIISQYGKVSAQQFKIKGTPAIFVNGQRIEGFKKIAELKNMIGKVLK